MPAENINMFTLLLFFGLHIIVGYAFYSFFKRQIDFNKTYPLLATGKYFYLKYIFLWVCFFLLSISIFQIKIGTKTSYQSGTGVDVMFVLDVSKSMNVADIQDDRNYYTRLDVAKKHISDFVVTKKENRYGLVIFAGEALSVIPLTDDTELFLTFLSGVDYKNLLKQGTDFQTAIKMALSRFLDEKSQKMLVFISDGGDDEETISIKEISSYVKNMSNIESYVFGVGTQKGGKIIQGQDFFGRYQYQTYRGEEIISRLHSSNLKQVAQALGANYSMIHDLKDMKINQKKLQNFSQDLTKTSQEKIDFGRILGIWAAVSFLLFLLLYIFDRKLGKNF